MHLERKRVTRVLDAMQRREKRIEERNRCRGGGISRRGSMGTGHLFRPGFWWDLRGVSKLQQGTILGGSLGTILLYLELAGG